MSPGWSMIKLLIMTKAYDNRKKISCRNFSWSDFCAWPPIWEAFFNGCQLLLATRCTHVRQITCRFLHRIFSVQVVRLASVSIQYGEVFPTYLRLWVSIALLRYVNYIICSLPFVNSHPWENVSYAFWLRYPNPFASHGKNLCLLCCPRLSSTNIKATFSYLF